MNVKTKKMIRFMVLALLIGLISSLFTGCGMAGADTRYSDVKFETNNGSEYSSSKDQNKLLVVWKDRITSANENGGHDKSAHNGLWAVPMRVDVDYGIKSESSIAAPFRSIAILMYNSVFQETYGANDMFSCWDFGSFNLHPVSVLAQTEQVTGDVLANGGPLSAIQASVQGLASAILIAIWAIGFLQQVVNERFTFETLLKTLMQLMCGIALVMNTEMIVEAFAGLGGFAQNQNYQNIAWSAFEEQIYGWLTQNIVANNIGISIGGFFSLGLGTVWVDMQPLLVILFLAIPVYAQITCAYKIVSIMIMRTLELSMRLTLMPIPLAFGAQQGFSHDMIRFFRELVACALQPLLMLAGVLCLDTIAAAILKLFGQVPGSVDGPIAVIGITLSYFVLSAYLNETKRLARDIIAH